MCGRFIRTASRALLARMFGIDLADAIIERRFNIAPSQAVLAVTNTAPRKLEPLRWGLIPFWAKDEKIAYQCINARSETAAVKPAFREAFKKRRCLIPSDGFYEWRKNPDKTKTPMLVRLASGEPFAMAGLWEEWTSPKGELIRSCTVLTTSANELLAKVHDRMPVILPPEAWDAWLDPNPRKPEELLPLMKPFDPKLMAVVPVSPLVNDPKIDREECALPAKP